MTQTGRIDYSPDYKSKKSKAAKLVEEVDRHLRPHLYYEGFKAKPDSAAEHTRLRDAVVEASVAYAQVSTVAAHQRWVDATRTLIEFEAKQDQK